MTSPCTVWAIIVAHKTTISLAAYFLYAIGADNLPLPARDSSAFYRWFFTVAQAIAANLIRARVRAATTTKGK